MFVGELGQETAWWGEVGDPNYPPQYPQQQSAVDIPLSPTDILAAWEADKAGLPRPAPTSASPFSEPAPKAAERPDIVGVTIDQWLAMPKLTQTTAVAQTYTPARAQAQVATGGLSDVPWDKILLIGGGALLLLMLLRRK